MRIATARAARALAFAAGLAVACIAGAQSPAVSSTEADQAKQQAAQQQVQPLNNQPVWKEIRSGEAQYTSIPGRETNILIQPQGQTWRAGSCSSLRCSHSASSTCGAGPSVCMGSRPAA